MDRAETSMRFDLKTLSLNGEAVEFSCAWLDMEREGFMTSWTGFVQGGGNPSMLDSELRLAAETADGRQLTGQVLVGSLRGDDFPLQGTGPLLVDGREPVR